MWTCYPIITFNIENRLEECLSIPQIENVGIVCTYSSKNCLYVSPILDSTWGFCGKKLVFSYILKLFTIIMQIRSAHNVKACKPSKHSCSLKLLKWPTILCSLRNKSYIYRQTIRKYYYIFHSCNNCQTINIYIASFL